MKEKDGGILKTGMGLWYDNYATQNIEGGRQMDLSETAKKLQIDEDELLDFTSRNGINVFYASEEDVINLYLQRNGHKGGERPTVTPEKAVERPAVASETRTNQNEPLKNEDISIKLLRKIAENTEKAAFWIRFWSILSLISGIIVIIYILINVL